MGTTTHYKAPFPEPTAAPNVPLHLQNGLQVLDTALKAVEDNQRRMRVRVYHSGGTSIPNNVLANTALNWSGTNYMEGGTWWATAEWVTAPVAGVYSILGVADYEQGAGSGWKTAEIWSNGGGGTVFLARTTMGSVAWTQEIRVSWEGRLAAGEKFKLVTNQTTGGALRAWGWMAAHLVARD